MEKYRYKPNEHTNKFCKGKIVELGPRVGIVSSGVQVVIKAREKNTDCTAHIVEYSEY